MSNEVATIKGAPLAVNDDMLAAMGMTAAELEASQGIIGMEGARPEDFQIPRLQIAQALSPQLQRSKPEYIPGLMVGQFFNTVTGENYGDSVLVVPIKHSISRLRFFNNTLDCQSKNGIEGPRSPIKLVTLPDGKVERQGGCANCEFSKWGTGKDKKGTDCKEYRNWLVLDTSNGMPMSISFKSASLVVSKNWGTKIASRKIKLPSGVVKDAPAYVTVYKLVSAEKQTPGGTFFVPVITPEHDTPNDLIGIASSIHRSFKGEIVDNLGDHEE
jgi:hypothetical protein